MRQGCTRRSRWQVGLTMYGLVDGQRTVPVKATLGLRVCNEHKDDMTVDDLVTDEGWRQIERGFDSVGRLRPTRSLNELRFDALN